MRGPVCEMCDKGSTILSPRGWCLTCEDEFKRVMAHVKCAQENGVCESPISCLMVKRCVQLRAAVALCGGTMGPELERTG